MPKYDRLIGEERQSQNGYIDPISGQFTTHEEVDAHVEVLKHLGEWNFPTPNSRRLAQGAQKDFGDKRRRAVAKRNNPTQ